MIKEDEIVDKLAQFAIRIGLLEQTLAETREEFDEALELVADLVAQQCFVEKDGSLYSIGLRSLANGIAFLVKHDKMEYVEEGYGRSVHAKWKLDGK